jgi:hypothetical protein
LGRDNAVRATPQQRLLLELARSFVAIPIRKHQDAICSLARALADPDAEPLDARDSRRRRTPHNPFFNQQGERAGSLSRCDCAVI